MSYIVGVLETNSKVVFGMTKHNIPLYLFKPLDPNLSEMIVGSKERNTLQNYLALVEGPGAPKLTDSHLNFHPVRGNLNRILGPCGDKNAEAEALLWHYCLSYQKPYKNIFVPNVSDYDERVDLASWFTVNIDPEGCEDIDDCISYSLEGERHYFAVTIADVSEQIDWNSSYTSYAYEIGQSFYSNNKVRSMFPKEIEKEVSLTPGEAKLGLSLIFEWDFNEKKILSSRFQKSIIYNKVSLSYEKSMKYDKPEFVRIREFLIQLCEGVNDSHAWIEKLMIMYNIEAAKLLQNHRVGIFRKQKNKELNRYDNTLINCCPFLAIEAAEYCGYSEDLHHSILKVNAYTQVTSPIRRYVDLINQKILKLVLKLQDSSKVNDIENLQVFKELDYAHFNRINKQVKQHDRDLFFLNTLMSPKVQINGWILNTDSELTETCKLRVYVPEWKRIINIKNIPFSDLVDTITPSKFVMKEKVKLDYFYDPSKAGWKNRMIFKIY